MLFLLLLLLALFYITGAHLYCKKAQGKAKKVGKYTESKLWHAFFFFLSSSSSFNLRMHHFFFQD